MTSTTTVSVRSTPDMLLRLVLRANAATSALGGLVAAAVPGPLDELLETGQQTWVRLVGVGLVAFAVVVVVTSRMDTDRMEQVVPAISAGDICWVVATIAAIALGWFSTGGAVLIGAVGLMVGTFGVTQVIFVRALRTGHVVPGTT